MNRGYIKLWRKSLDNDLIRNQGAWQLMNWCLLRASHKAHKQIVGAAIVDLKPGQLIFGRTAVARELKSTERKIRTSLELLKKTDFLTIETTNRFSIITIVNWAIYQEERPVNDQPGDQEATSKRPANDHKQECKECKEEEYISTSSARARLDDPLPTDGQMSPAESAVLLAQIRPEFEAAWPEAPKTTMVSDRMIYCVIECAAKMPAMRDIEAWRGSIKRSRASPFLRGEVPGRNGSRFAGMSLDWFLKPETQANIVNGLYDERKPAKRQPPPKDDEGFDPVRRMDGRPLKPKEKP